MEQLEANGEFFFTVCSMIGGFLLFIGFILNSLLDGSSLDDLFDGAENLDLSDGGELLDLSDIDEPLEVMATGELPSVFVDTAIGAFDIPIPSFFSFKILRIILLVFGLGGNIALHILKWSFWESFFFGLGAGWLSGYIVYRALVYIYNQTIFHSSDPQIIGRIGKVTLEIPSEGMGQIMIEIVQQRQIYRATSANKIKIEMNTQIQVIGKNKGVCIVRAYVKKTTI